MSVDASTIDVLIVTGGLTPQVVTGTIYALATIYKQNGPQSFLPTRIICAITANVADRFGSNLANALNRLAEEVGIPPTWEAHNIVIPKRSNGTQLEDVRTAEDSVIFGDFISELVRTETLESRKRVYLSLAGGRKTMSFYGGAAMSLWARPQDRLLHVLIEISSTAADQTLQPEDFERAQDFWFPTTATADEKPILGGRNQLIRASDANVILSEIPFVPLRDLLPERSTNEELSYAAWVGRFREALADRVILRLNTVQRTVRIGDIASFKLPPVEYALYQLIAERARDSLPGAGPEGVGSQHHGWISWEMLANPMVCEANPIERFMRIYANACAFHSEKADGMQNNLAPDPVNKRQQEGNKTFFQPHLSKLRKNIKSTLSTHAVLVARFCPERTSGKKHPRFGLMLSRSEIEIEDAPHQ